MYSSQISVGTKAYLIYAGLEPPEFLVLFPPYVRSTDAIAYHQFEVSNMNKKMALFCTSFMLTYLFELHKISHLCILL